MNGAITNSVAISLQLVLRLFLLISIAAITAITESENGGVFAWTPPSMATSMSTSMPTSMSMSLSITTRIRHIPRHSSSIINSNSNNSILHSIRARCLQLQAKKRPNSRDDPIDDMSSWYDPVDNDATPDQVFFQEMERQRLTNQVGGDNMIPNVDSITSSAGAAGGRMTGGTARPTTPSALRSTGGSASSPRFANAPLPMATFPQPLMGGGGGGMNMNGSNFNNNNNMDPPPFRRRSVPTMDQIKIAEATLSEYETFQVSDNWLNEELQAQMWNDDNIVFDDDDDNNNNNNNDREATASGRDDDRTEEQEIRRLFQDGSNEPWDDFGDEAKDVDWDRRNILEVPFPTKGM